MVLLLMVQCDSIRDSGRRLAAATEGKATARKHIIMFVLYTSMQICNNLSAEYARAPMREHILENGRGQNAIRV